VVEVVVVWEMEYEQEIQCTGERYGESEMRENERAARKDDAPCCRYVTS